MAIGEQATVLVQPSGSPQTPEPTQRVYFPELDGLRFIAFMMVYLFHGGVPAGIVSALVGSLARWALFLATLGLASDAWLSNCSQRVASGVAGVFRENGGYGVQLFFILSGYLITALLLREEAQYGRIALRAFWVRRILRIWPLYYLIVLVGFVLLPGLEGQLWTSAYRNTLGAHLVPFLGFLGNWSMILFGPLPDWLSVLWSVCVEEQFYLIVPLFIAMISPRFRLPLVIGLILSSIAVRGACAVFFSSQLMIVFNTLAQFDTLLSGVLLALVLGWERHRPRLTRWLRWLQWPLYLIIGWVMSQPHLGHGTAWHRTWDFVWVWLCGLGVVVVAIWGQGWLRAALSYSRAVWLGKISYGLYMYHEIALWIRERYFERLGWFPNKDELLAIATLALVIALAAASYYGYERRFLELKRAWTRVPSRPV
jgi:peptidoglycan/LPS O-acetylase OafA/YrhL